MQIVRFVVVGLINTIVGLLLIYLFMLCFGANYILANLLGYTASFFLSFTLHNKWTFSYSGSRNIAIFRWLLVVCFSYLLNITVVVLSHSKGTPTAISQIFGVLAYSSASYFGGRYFAFNKPR